MRAGRSENAAGQGAIPPPAALTQRQQLAQGPALGPEPSAPRPGCPPGQPQRHGEVHHRSRGPPFLRLCRRSSAAAWRPQRSGSGRTTGRISDDSWSLCSASRSP
ncbi:hypothetical protein NDU88_003386 [Pleurodeles waltl]|uniref:Uncharacterized protein n=1 Tax=Pleurodeles waltl TaxID=8319 RepID=A0AAV7LFQ1_PLEWA|nr:hypothetical protein NDU88_003386 [Pleurodeles waltl]